MLVWYNLCWMDRILQNSNDKPVVIISNKKLIRLNNSMHQIFFLVIDICKKILTGSFTLYFSFSPLSRWSFYCFLPLLTQNTFFIFFLFEFREFPGNNLKMFMFQFLDPNIAWNVFYFISFITNKILGMDYNRSLNLLHKYINFYYFSTPECFCYDACLSLLCFITRALQSK